MPQIEIEPAKCRLDKRSADGTSGALCLEFCLCLYESPAAPVVPTQAESNQSRVRQKIQ
jgi:hypothetical protein